MLGHISLTTPSRGHNDPLGGGGNPRGEGVTWRASTRRSLIGTNGAPSGYLGDGPSNGHPNEDHGVDH
jgi:hypothetical protein